MDTVHLGWPTGRRGRRPLQYGYGKESSCLRIGSSGGVFMCRKTYLRGCCLCCLGLGLILGHCLESWFLCCCGGVALLVLGCSAMGRR